MAASLAEEAAVADKDVSRTRSIRTTDNPAPDLMLLAVTVNGQRLDDTFLFMRRGTEFLVATDALDALKLKAPPGATETVDGQQFVALSSFHGLVAKYDPGDQRMALTLPSETFVGTTISALDRPPEPSHGTFAAFVNYELALAYQHDVTGSGVIETGITDAWGFASNTVLVGQGIGTKTVTRLDTYFLRDNPDKLTRLVIGDTVTDARDWTRQVRFGGVRFGTEFATQPNLITFPTPSFAGSAVVPSNVELYVNDALRYQTDVGRGPFSINQAPVVTGAGDVKLVVRDPLGVEHSITSSYYVSSRLLRRGLSAWSVEAGGERRNYGQDNLNYKNPFAAGTYRRGMTRFLTSETRAEISSEVQMVGSGANFVVPAIGEFGIAGALSHGRIGSGALYRVFFSRISPSWSVSASYQRTTPHYSELGAINPAQQIQSQLQAGAGLSLGRLGNVGASYTDLRYGDDTRARVASASYNVGIGSRGFLNLYALDSRFDGGRRATTIGLGFTIAFANNASANVQVDNHGVGGGVQRTAPLAGGLGYRASAGTGQQDYQQGQLDWRGRSGTYSLQAARFDGETSVRALASGGLLLVGGDVFATRRSDDGFAVIDVPDQANVRIYQENRVVARTNKNGRAIVSDLRAYEPNQLGIAAGDLPINAALSVDSATVVPRFHGAVHVVFDTQVKSSATVVLQNPDGTPVEAGTSATIDGNEETFVGFGGELFAQSVHAGSVVDLDSAAGRCRVTIGAIPNDNLLPRIGPLRCTILKEAA